MEKIDNFENKLQSLAGSLPSNRTNENKGNASEDFSSRFITIFDQIKSRVVMPIISQANSIIGSKGFKLVTVDSPENISRFRKSVEIVFSENDTDINILSDPSLVIEGYPQSNVVRFYESGSAVSSPEILISEINKEMIQEKVYTFLEHQLNDKAKLAY